ncbi:hypothetical protein CTI14_00560 [Methylobacterium radiotolerans]|nr:hypothetical protein CTI14_00560 [Methylobacterium radiotolerans]
MYNEAKIFVDEMKANMINNAIRALSEFGYTAGTDTPPRDHAYGQYTLPLPPGEDMLHERLVDLIFAEVKKLMPSRVGLN